MQHFMDDILRLPRDETRERRPTDEKKPATAVAGFLQKVVRSEAMPPMQLKT